MTTNLNDRRRSTYLNDAQGNSPTLMLLVLFSTIGALLYAGFILNPANRGDLLPYILVVIAEVFLLFQAIIAMWTILAGGNSPRTFGFHDAQEHLFANKGSKIKFRSMLKDDVSIESARNLALHLHQKEIKVDVFITVYGEPLNIIRETAIAARKMIGRHTTYILDDGKSNDVKKLAKEIGVQNKKYAIF